MSSTVTKTKISQQTMTILKNFAGINSNLHVKPGNVISTISPSSTILAEATVSEAFDVDFGIWDMSQFLSTMSLFKDAELEFDENGKFVTIASPGSKASVKYFFSEPSLLSAPPDKKISMPKVVLSFHLSEENISAILRAASVLQAPDMCVESCEEGVCVRVCDKKNSSAHSWSLVVHEGEQDNEFQFWLKVENMKLLPGDYDVSFAEKKVVKFVGPVTYWIALESDSTINKG
jgi:hypothetical protein